MGLLRESILAGGPTQLVPLVRADEVVWGDLGELG